MRKLSWLSLVLVAAACGRGFDDPPTHEEPLVECGDLDRVTCGARADCRVENLACPEVCLDDGRGGCLPCNAFRCLPVAPAACETLSDAQCGARSDCHLEQPAGDIACAAVCIDDGRGGCQPCPTPPSRCVSGPPACASLNQVSCQARPDCRFEGVPMTGTGGEQGAPQFCPAGAACDPVPGRCVDAPCGSLDPLTCRTRSDCRVAPGAAGLPDQGFAPCAPDSAGCQRPIEEHCVDAVVDCYQLDPTTCASRPDCRVLESDCGGACDPTTGACPDCAQRVSCVPATALACELLDANTCSARSDCHLEAPPCAECIDCLCDATPRCASNTPPSCYGLDDATCSTRPDCMLEQVSTCDACVPGAACPPCRASNACVPVHPVDFCAGLDEATCALRPGCEVQQVGVCPGCVPGAQCPPCGTESICVMSRPVDTCSGLDVAACSARSDCSLEEVTACPACAPGANCPPCTSQFVCLPAAPPSPCLGLDLATCSTDSRCEVVTYACTQECRDDGRGGCLPCEVPPPSCQPVSTGPVAGCGG